MELGFTMKQLVYYIVICFLVASMLPIDAFALDADAGLIEPPEVTVSTPVFSFALDALSKEQQPTEPPVAPPPAAEVTSVGLVPNTLQIQSEPLALQLAPIPADAEVIVSGVEVSGGRLQALELRSMSDKFVNLANWTADVVYVHDGQEAVCEIQPSGYLYVKQYFTLTQTGRAIGLSGQAQAEPYEADLDCSEAAGVLTYIEIYPSSHASSVGPVERVNLEALDVSARDGRWIRKDLTATYRKGIFTNDFPNPAKGTQPRLLYFSDVYYPPEASPLQITEIYANPLLCAAGNTSVLCKKYVKVTNVSTDAVDLAQYRLRSGSPLTSATTANTSTLSGIVAAGETVLLQQTSQGSGIYLAASEGTVWFQDMYGLQDYDSEVTPYSGAGNVGNQGLTWAYDTTDGQWKWSLPSPDAAINNIRLPDVKPIKVAALSQLTPCKDGQYRSEETNRCRSIALAGSTLLPCKDNQYRSEETNRCRSIVTASTNLVPCKDNQYRSEETNRCRNIAATAIPNAAFAVTPVKETGKAFVGWWALGGVGLLAAGYGAWEWRREVANGMRRVVSFFHSGK